MDIIVSTKREISLSVIIPVYNCPKYVEAAVESVVRQPVAVNNIIMVDDGSTDTTGLILEQLAAKYPHVCIIHQQNAGVSAARNTGIEWILNNSKSEYLMFLDADDVWYNNWLQADVAELLNKKYDIVAFDYCNAEEKLTRRTASHHMVSGIILGGDKAVTADHQTFAAAAYRCEFLKKNKIRFHIGQRLSEDTQFKHEARCLANQCLFVERLVYVYRNNPDSAVKQTVSAISQYTELFEGYIKTHEFLLKNGFDGKSAQGAITWYLNDMCIAHFRQNGTRQELFKVLVQYADYIDIYEVKTDEEKANAYLSRYSKRFEYMQNLYGFVFKWGRNLMRLSCVKSIRNRRRYPFELKD